MEILHLVWFLFIGLGAGFLAGKIMTGRGLGLLWDLVIGVIGSFVGGLLFWILGLGPTSIIGQLIAATAGAIVLLAGIKYIKRV
jgi:uncharacterized membrane protein YeaQ/YmgE (transglycosylase-associated protein family)